MKSKAISVKKTIGRILHEIGDDASEKSLTTHELDLNYLLLLLLPKRSEASDLISWWSLKEAKDFSSSTFLWPNQ